MRRFDASTTEEYAFEMARYRVRKMRRFFIHLTVYLIVLAVCLAKKYLDAPFNFWPFRILNDTALWIWTFIIAVQGLKLLFQEMVFDSQWERRKLKEYLSKEEGNKGV